MISDFKRIEDLFIELNKSLHKKADVYVIGGGALLRRRLKEATKDIDLVVATRLELIEIQVALVKINFRPQIPGREYRHMDLSQIFQREDFRIDLFEKTVCGKFSLSESMMQRSEKVISLSHLNVFLCSNEDIFLFKTMTERDGDLNDCVSIASFQKPDWNVILGELKSQIKQSRQDVWVTWVGERFDLLVGRGLDIPIMDEVDKLREAFFDDLERRQKNTGGIKNGKE